jgi:hypothetical protein
MQEYYIEKTKGLLHEYLLPIYDHLLIGQYKTSADKYPMNKSKLITTDFDVVCGTVTMD